MRTLAILSLLGLATLWCTPGLAATARSRATASTSLQNDTGKFTPELAFDGRLKTVWEEGAPGSGEGSWVEIDLVSPTVITSLSIWPGNLSEGAKSYREHTRPHTIRVLVDGVQIGDPIRLLDEVQRKDLPMTITGRKVRVVVDQVYEGFVFPDCSISEVAVNYEANVGKTDPRIQAWLDSKPGQDAHAAYIAELTSKTEAIKAAEFGDSAALDWIMDAAGDGAPYLREQVLKLVPEGFGAAALPPDPDAMTALRKIKDPNSIPAIEMAELRAVGADRRKLEELVEIFYAWQQLIGGADPNVPYWGKAGWANGALQSFNEPMNLVVDRFGGVYVADIGNNRLQRYAEDGRPDRVWGGTTDISNTWFHTGRPWYVAGSAPGTTATTFTNPLDVELIPAKETDGFAVLDALGHVRIYDGDGRNVIGWNVISEGIVESGVGGEGYLAWMPQQKLLYVFWDNEVVGYDLDGQEQARFNIKDGTPNAVVADKGHFLLAYRDEIVRYEIDGFRYGQVADLDDWVQGFEDVDLSMDENGKLWVVVDTGYALKFKRPGKLDFMIKVTDFSLEKPRIAVRDDIVFLCERDRILRLDALQLQLDQEEAAKEAPAE